MDKLIHSVASVDNGQLWGSGKFYTCSCGTTLRSSDRFKNHIDISNNPIEIDYESQEWKDNSRRVLSTYEMLSSIKLDDIFAKYDELGFSVIADTLKYDYASHRSDSKIVFIDGEFIRSERNDDELSYILLFMLFHIVENESASIDRDPYSESYGDVFARLVFAESDKDVPLRFRNNQ